MANNTVTIGGMFGDGKTYFANSPVVIDISGLKWSEDGRPVTSPFTIVRLEVIHENTKVGEFKVDTGGQTSISFDISSALRAIWSDYGFADEVAAANEAAQDHTTGMFQRPYREYSLIVYTEYLSSDDGGVFTKPSFGPFPGGRCSIGEFTEWERSMIPSKEDSDVSYRDGENRRFGDASTKPTTTPERVGSESITSWVDVSNDGTKSVFYESSYQEGQGEPDIAQEHAPNVLRDTVPYTDFLFLNRRGAVETCSGQMLESLSTSVETKQFTLIGRPSFAPARSLTSIGSGGRRSWQMSSGYVTREWAEWWAMEFLAPRKNRRHWMLYQGRYVPVIVTPAKNDITFYDRSKQQMMHVDFTVTLALEG